MKNYFSVITVLVFCWFHCPLHAEIRLPSVFSDHMVLQQKAKVPIWGWADPGEKIVIQAGWSSSSVKTTTGPDGKWKTFLKTPKAGGPYELTVKGASGSVAIHDVLLGEVWLCSGQSNMVFYLSSSAKGKETIAHANYPKIRYMEAARQVSTTPMEKDTASTWKVTQPENVASNSAVAMYFAIKLQKELKVPVGVIEAAWGGTAADNWTPVPVLKNDKKLSIAFDRFDQWKKDFKTDSIGYNAALKAFQDGTVSVKPDYPRSMYIHDRPHRQPGGLYNGMINPLKNFKIKGVLWYQGETNRKWNTEYEHLLKKLIKSWRTEWGYDFPFYFAQIAKFGGHAPDQVSKIMEAQLQVYHETKNTGVVCTMDVGNMHKIHYTHKKPVGERFAKWALANTYGKKGIQFSGPLIKKAKQKGKKVKLLFDFTGSGLMAQGKPQGFETVEFNANGTQKPPQPITPKIKGEVLQFDSAGLSKPFLIRYGWGQEMENANLFNKEGLPAASFRLLIR